MDALQLTQQCKSRCCGRNRCEGKAINVPWQDFDMILCKDPYFMLSILLKKINQSETKGCYLKPTSGYSWRCEISGSYKMFIVHLKLLPGVVLVLQTNPLKCLKIARGHDFLGGKSPKATAPSSATPNFHEAWAPYPSPKPTKVTPNEFPKRCQWCCVALTSRWQSSWSSFWWPVKGQDTNKSSTSTKRNMEAWFLETKLMDVNECHPFIWNQSLWPHAVRAVSSYNVGIPYFYAMCN